MIVVAGEALIDLVIDLDGRVDAVLGGAPFNTARACGRLGVDVGFVGAISNDRFGSMLASQLETDGASTTHATRVDEPTTLAAAELDEHGSAQYLFYIDGTSAPLLASTVDTGSVEAVFTGGLALVLEPMAATVETMVSDRPDGCLAMVDVNCRALVIRDRESYLQRIERVVANADVVKASDDDLDYLLPDLDTARAAEHLLSLGASVVLVTTGADRVDVHTPRGQVSVPVRPVHVVDTIGAGDSFSAGFLAWWTTTNRSKRDLGSLDTLAAAVEAANAVAGLTCERRGADPPWRSELPDTWGCE